MPCGLEEIELSPENLGEQIQHLLGTEECDCGNLTEIFKLIGIRLNCQEFPFQHTILSEIVYNVIFNATIALALLGNCTVLWIVGWHARMRTVTNYYLLNLAVADIAISVLNTNFSWSYNFYYNWQYGNYCGFNNLMTVAPISASVFTMIVMSVDRYWAIVHPLRRRPGRRATIGVICAIWVLSILTGVPAMLGSELEDSYHWNGVSVFKSTACVSDNFPDGRVTESSLFWTYNMSLTLIQYVIPLVVLSLAYFRVACVLRRKEALGDSRHNRTVLQKKKASTMLSLVVFIFMTVWLPYHVYFLTVTYFYVPMAPMTSLYIGVNVYLLGMSSTMFNPIIYYFMNKRFRVGFRYAFRWLPFIHASKSEYRSVLAAQPRPSLVAYQASQSHFTEF